MKTKKDRVGYQFTNKDGDIMKIVEYHKSSDFYAVNIATGARYHGSNWKTQVEGKTLGAGKGAKKKVTNIDSSPSLEEAWNCASPEERERFFANRFDIQRKYFELYLPGSDGGQVIYKFAIGNKREAKRLCRSLRVREVEE